MGHPAINHKGETYNRWTILTKTINGKVKAQCSCGKRKEVLTTCIVNGVSKSCGCFKSEYMKNKMTRHGESKTKLHSVWISMNSRCTLNTTTYYKNYGGRGISVCEEWRNSFETFRDWSNKNGYGEHLSIDRINNDGNYEPTNCRWTDRTTQQNNNRYNRLVTINGKTHTMAQWARLYKLNYGTFKYRVNHGITGMALLNN